MTTSSRIFDVIALTGLLALLVWVVWSNRHSLLKQLRLRTVNAESVAWDTYFAAEKAAGRIMWRDLPRARNNPTRWAILWGEWAFLNRLMAHVSRTAFGPHPLEDEGGRDRSVSHGLAADLMRMVADTELALAGITPRVEELAHRTWLISELFDEEHSGVQFTDLAHRLASDRNLVERYRLMRLMWHEVYPVVGGQAAEALVSCGRVYLAAAGWPRSAINAEIDSQDWAADDLAEVAARDLQGSTR